MISYLFLFNFNNTFLYSIILFKTLYISFSRSLNGDLKHYLPKFTEFLLTSEHIKVIICSWLSNLMISHRPKLLTFILWSTISHVAFLLLEKICRNFLLLVIGEIIVKSKLLKIEIILCFSFHVMHGVVRTALIRHDGVDCCRQNLTSICRTSSRSPHTISRPNANSSRLSTKASK